MKIKIEYGKKDCVSFYKIYTDGSEYLDGRCRLSRVLTGTSKEDGFGIFTDIDDIGSIESNETINVWFQRGTERKSFSFQRLIRGSVIPQLKERIVEVRSYFDKFDYENTESGVL